MKLKTINVGAYPEDQNADTVRDAFIKVNTAFKELETSEGELSAQVKQNASDIKAEQQINDEQNTRLDVLEEAIENVDANVKTDDITIHVGKNWEDEDVLKLGGANSKDGVALIESTVKVGSRWDERQYTEINQTEVSVQNGTDTSSSSVRLTPAQYSDASIALSRTDKTNNETVSVQVYSSGKIEKRKGAVSKTMQLPEPALLDSVLAISADGVRADEKGNIPLGYGDKITSNTNRIKALEDKPAPQAIAKVDGVTTSLNGNDAVQLGVGTNGTVTRDKVTFEAKGGFNANSDTVRLFTDNKQQHVNRKTALATLRHENVVELVSMNNDAAANRNANAQLLLYDGSATIELSETDSDGRNRKVKTVKGTPLGFTYNLKEGDTDYSGEIATVPFVLAKASEGGEGVKVDNKTISENQNKELKVGHYARSSDIGNTNTIDFGLENVNIKMMGENAIKMWKDGSGKPFVELIGGNPNQGTNVRLDNDKIQIGKKGNALITVNKNGAYFSPYSTLLEENDKIVRSADLKTVSDRVKVLEDKPDLGVKTDNISTSLNDKGEIQVGAPNEYGTFEATIAGNLAIKKGNGRDGNVYITPQELSLITPSQDSSVTVSTGRGVTVQKKPNQKTAYTHGYVEVTTDSPLQYIKCEFPKPKTGVASSSATLAIQLDGILANANGEIKTNYPDRLKALEEAMSQASQLIQMQQREIEDLKLRVEAIENK